MNYKTYIYIMKYFLLMNKILALNKLSYFQNIALKDL
jgi:hypothetical protein